MARLPEKALLNQEKLGEVLQVDPRTIRRMVARFELPPPTKLGGRAVWMAGRVVQYLEAAMAEAEKTAIKERERIKRLSP